MQPVKSDQKYGFGDPTWYLIAQCLLSEETEGAEFWVTLKEGSLIQTMQAVGVPRECLVKLVWTIIGAVKETRRRSPPGGVSMPVLIRLFSQRMQVGSQESSEKPSSGGWGYYLIDRGRDFPSGNTGQSQRIIELYIYREGD